MKNIFIITLLFASSFLFAQTAIEYTYDNAGNRIQRKVQINVLPPNTETAAFAGNNSSNELNQSQKSILNSIKVFPNPTQDRLEITIGKELPNASIALFDLSGKLIKRHPLIDFTHSIDLSNQSSGEYILVIRNEAFVGQWKIVKVK